MKLKECKNRYSSENVRRGIVRGKSLSEELDCSTIVLTQVSRIDIQAYDLVELTNESNELEYWLVANYQRNTVSFEPLKYDYIIDLMSPTKILEGIILPNLTITNIGQNRSILIYIQNAMELYFENSYGDYVLSEELINLFGETICPEGSFNEPTLREYLDYLLGFKGCLSKLIYKNGEFVLSYLDLNYQGEELDTKYITKIEQSQNAEQYVTQLEHTLSDVIGQHPIVEYHNLKSDTFLFDSTTAKIILHNKPYDIKKIIVKNMSFQINAYLNIEGNSNTVDHAIIYFNSEHEEGNESGGLYRYINGVELDITKYLVVEEIFQSLETLEQGTFDVLDEELCNNIYQNNTLRWSRGSRIIDNFHYYQTKTSLWQTSDSEALTYAIQCAIYLNLNNFLETATYTNESGKQVTYSVFSDAKSGIVCDYEWSTDASNLVFEIEYIPFVNSKLKLERQGEYRHLVSAVDNSSNVQSDISSFIKKSFEKMNQLGNDCLLFYARNSTATSFKPIFKIGDYFLDEEEKYILSHLEYETKSNCILYKGILTKNYSNRNIHTIINREKRYYSLADSSQSLIRNEVKSRSFSLGLSNFYDSSILMLVKPFNVSRFYVETDEEGTKKKIAGYIPSITIAEKNLISHSILFEDNVIYATRVGKQQTGGYEMELLRYTNSSGELDYISVDFRLASGKDLDILLGCSSRAYEKEAFVGKSLGMSYKLLKDAREQLGLTVQNYIINSANSNIKVNESKISKLTGAKYVTITAANLGILLSGENLLKFGMPLHEIIENPITYPCSVSVDVDGETVIEIEEYNGEYLKLDLIS